MKFRKHIFALFLLACFCSLTLNSCKTGEGCAATEHYQAKTNKSGQLSTKKGKSNLFSKKQRKKM